MEAKIRAALTLYAFVVLGLFLLVAPWTAVWNRAIMGLLPGAIGRWALSGWARGAISGLGALNLAIAVQVANELWRAMRGGVRPADEP